MATATKTVCPITRDEFRQHAKAVLVQIDGQNKLAQPKEFSTDSLGFNISEKMVLTINGKSVTCQVGLNITVVGSKELPK